MLLFDLSRCSVLAGASVLQEETNKESKAENYPQTKLASDLGGRPPQRIL